MSVGSLDPKTFTIGKFEIVTWKLARERRHIVHIRKVETGETVWRQQLRPIVWERIQSRLKQLRSEDALA
jgi:hypothetical protein